MCPQTSDVNSSKYWTRNSQMTIDPLHKVFNRNTVKLSYGCLASIKQIVDGQNKGILAKQNVITTPNEKSCNCRKPHDCPVAEQCLKKSVIYQAMPQ